MKKDILYNVNLTMDNEVKYYPLIVVVLLVEAKLEVATIPISLYYFTRSRNFAA